MKFRYLIICCLHLAVSSYAQEKNECMKTVRECYAKLNNAAEKPSGNKVFYLNYTVETKMRDSLKNKNHSSVLEMFVGEKSSQIISKEISVFQDENDIFTVVPERKIIYRSDVAPQDMKEKRMKKFTIFQDTLLDMCKVQNCRYVKDLEGKNLLETELKLNEEARDKFKTDKLVLLIDNKEKKIEKLVTVNLPDEEISSISYLINAVNYDYNTNKLEKSSLENILDGQGKLLPVYKDYTLIDSRVKAKKEK